MAPGDAALKQPNLHPVYTVTNTQNKVCILDGIKVKLFKLHARGYKVLDHIDDTPPPTKTDTGDETSVKLFLMNKFSFIVYLIKTKNTKSHTVTRSVAERWHIATEPSHRLPVKSQWRRNGGQGRPNRHPDRRSRTTSSVAAVIGSGGRNR
ncbi:hypothetical protein OSB04_019850 [Centaurea solstitialis]|uniref:Uncharacterized protein n=1 Tax=Centaurea solstitialis TaxID=347529 RepID=A0AA38W5D7_9ASTR|nr:hypothetical protein OSB04_019850 [Centaurea solstitialis]